MFYFRRGAAWFLTIWFLTLAGCRQSPQFKTESQPAETAQTSTAPQTSASEPLQTISENTEVVTEEVSSSSSTSDSPTDDVTGDSKMGAVAVKTEY